MDKKKILIFAAIGVALYAVTKKETTTTCASGVFFKVGTQKVCDTDLVALGYVYWKGGANGDGWYKIKSFTNAFNLPAETFDTVIKNAALNTVTAMGAAYTNAQTVLNSYFIAGSTILVQA